ncbi:MAG: ABC transporter permease [Streptosporangiaceae bacterium]
MLKTTLAGLFAHKLRLLLTSLAITLGVGFIAGTFVLTDTMQSGYDQRFAAAAGNVDLAVLPAADALPAGLLAKIRALPGVREAEGTVRGDLPLLGKDGKKYADGVPPVGISLPGGRLQRFQLVSGQVPDPGEVALDRRVAARTGFGIGDTVQVLDPKKRPYALKVAGIADFGLDAEIGSRGALGLAPAEAARLTGVTGLREIDIAGDLDAADVQAVVGEAEVLTGTELSSVLSGTSGADIRTVKAALLMFGLVSLLVAGMVIYNTFSILIAQRMREFALLRCVGASRGQVFGSVLLESAIVGAVGSLFGLALGALLGRGAFTVFNAFGADFPAGTLMLAPRTIVVALFVGVAVTVLSALLPARTATAVAPIRALGDEREPGSARFRLGRPRLAAAVLFWLAGVAATFHGAVLMDPGEGALFTVAAGGSLVFLGVIALMPLLVRPLGRFAGALPARFGGVPGRLAVQNAQRTPRRTATTAIALTVGIGLMSMFAVAAASGRETSVRAIDLQVPVDFSIVSQSDRALPAELATALTAVPGVTKVIEVRSVEARFGRNDNTIATASTFDFAMVPTQVRDLKPGTVAVFDDVSKAEDLAAGTQVQLRTGRGLVPLTVGPVLKGDPQVGGVLLRPDDFQKYFGRVGLNTIYLNGGTDEGVRKALSAYDDVGMTSTATLKDQFDAAYDSMLLAFGGLLGLAVLIALFGIANTLTLSVVERTRESALLRALGLTKRQLRRMLLVEALIMSVIGALTGVALGLAYGWAATRALDSSIIFAIPYPQILGLILIATLAGALAGVLPARRAARASIVGSLA